MDENVPKPPVKKRRRLWIRRVLWSLVVLFVLTAVFHRWIFFSLVKLGVGAAEKAGHLQISYQLDGTIFTSLELSNVKVRALEPGPMKKLTLDRLAVHYHPWRAITQGMSALVESVEVRDLDLFLDATKAPPPRKKKTKKSDSTSIPFPKWVDIRGVRVRVETPTGLLDIDKANLTLFPDRAGTFTVDHLIIPNYRTFQNLHAVTSYRDRDLNILNLTVVENVTVERLRIDASKVEEEKLAFQLVGKLFEGSLVADIALSNLGTTGDMAMSVAADHINLSKTASFFAPKSPLTGTLDSLALQIKGRTSNPATWNGILAVRMSQPSIGKLAFDSGAMNVNIQNGNFLFSETAFLRGDQWLTIGGNMQLPGTDRPAQPFLAGLVVSGNFPNLSTLIPDASGSAAFNATLGGSAKQIEARLDGEILGFSLRELALDSAQLTGRFVKSSSTKIDWTQPWWKNTNIDARLDSSRFLMSGYQIDQIGVTVLSENENVNIQSVKVLRGQNSLQANGKFVFQETPAGPLPGVLDLNLKILGPMLQEFSIDPEDPIVSGQAEGDGTLHWESAQPEARLHLSGTQLIHRGVALGTLEIDAEASNGRARLKRMQLDLPGESFVQATGEFNMLTKDHYLGQLSTRLTDLSQFKPLLSKAMAETPLAGEVAIDWNGSGQISNRQHEGNLNLTVKDAVYSGVTGIQLKTSGYYTPIRAEFPVIELTTSKGNLSTSIAYLDRVLKINNLKLAQNNETRLAGNIAFPVDLEQIANSEKRFPLDEPIAIDLVGREVQLGGLFTDLGMTAPVSGRVSLDIKSKGTLRNLDALIAFKAVDLKSDKIKQLQPINTEINVAILNQRANLSGTIQEPSLQPIALSGSVPLDLASMISTGTVSRRLPIQAKASMAPSSLAFLPRYVSAIDSVEGTVSFDVSMEGTLEKPVLFGGAKANLQSVRFRSDGIPSIRGFVIDAAFRDNKLTLNQIKGDMAGGPFSAGGAIDFTKPAEPVFDLKLQGRSILIVRNDTVIVRSNVDLAIKGPLTSADVTGTVGITDSRFFREIDILPINLPGRPAPAIPDKRPDLGFPDPPLRDWKFNVAIKTLDSFRITGNLANGEVTVDLALGGTGLAPTLDGMVQIFRLRASLPFSRLDIDYGNIYFSKDLPPLNPVLDLRGKSRVRDYVIDAYIWGDLVKPQNLFLSQPPLSQEDILTLLATGVTQSEIAENPQLLAGRAGYLFIQKYYNKIFRKKQSFEQDSFADKLDVQVGNIDAKTGRESATARLRLSDQWQVIGDLDLTGGVRGQVRYLIRFK